MWCLIVPVACLLLLLLLLCVVWNNVADADLTLLWNDQFGQQPGNV